MNEITKELFDKHEIRKKHAQKDAFIEFVSQHAEKNNCAFSLNEETSGLKNRNIIIGDVKTAKIVCTAHYDTCAVMLVPNFITPRNIFVYIIYQLVLTAMMFAVSLAVFLALDLLFDLFFVSALGAYVTLISLLVLLMAGPANKHTANDNTSGVSLLLRMMSEMTDEQKAKTALVFFDNEELGCLGSGYFKKTYGKLADKLLLNFDCISDGDTILFSVSKTTREMTEYQRIAECMNSLCDGKSAIIHKAETTLYPSDQMNFTTTVAVASMKKCFLGIYMDRIHTKRDTVYDEKNIDQLLGVTKKIIDTIQ